MIDLAGRMDAGDIVIDGGNTYYRDDIDRAEALAPEGHPLRRRRHERRRVRPRAGLLPDDRRRGRRRHPPRPDLPHHRARRSATSSARRAARGDAVAERAGLPALRPGRRRPLREDGAQRHRVRAHGGLRRGPQHPRSDADVGNADARDRRRDHARCATRSTTSTTSTPTEVAEVWRRGSVVASWLLDLTAAALVDDPELGVVRGTGVRLGRGPVDRRSPPSTRACPRRCSPRRSTSGSRRAARPTSPTRCCRPCASSSAATTRSRPAVPAHLGRRRRRRVHARSTARPAVTLARRRPDRRRSCPSSACSARRSPRRRAST